AGAALGGDGVVVPGAADGLEGFVGVVEDGPSGTSRIGGAGSVGVVEVVSVGGADAGGADGVVEVVSVNCWTKGSLLLKRPNEISWFESRTTTTRSLGSCPAGTTGAPAAPADVAEWLVITASFPPLPPRTFASPKPRMP